MKYLVFFLALIVFFTYSFVTERVEKFKNFRYKKQVFAGILIALFVVRYFCVDKHTAYNNIVGLEMISTHLGIGGAEAVFALIADWLSVAMFVTAAIRLFFDGVKLNAVDNFIKYVFPVGSVLCLVFLTEIHTIIEPTSLVEGDHYNSTKLFTVMLMTECGAYLALAADKWLESVKEGHFSDKNNFTVKSILTSVLIGLLIMLVTMPAYFCQFVFGNYVGYAYAYDMSPTHRIFIYLMFIIPLTIYFSLRGKSEEIKRFSLIFLGVATMVTYSVEFNYTTLFDLSAWPFHLCNTAMFVIPVCLIFRWKKLFYFTYFINVFGAVLAMLMPNYSSHANLLSYGMFHFWVNHWCAFFFPLLCVGLGQFDRPDIKRFGWSMLWFFLYYVLVLGLNVYFTAHGKDADFFFINSTFIAEKFGDWAEQIFNLTASFEINGFTYTFHPVYQLIYYVSYIALGFGMWYVYELFFTVSDKHKKLREKYRKIKLDEYALMASLNGRSVEEPMNKDAGVRLELKNFSKKYGNNKHYSVHDVSLTVYGGEIFGFLGPNGAGKSTIIKSIVGIQPITEGSIEVCGYDCARQPVMSKRQIGYVPDHYALYEKLTGREYINYIADIFGVSQEDRDKRIEEYVKLFELEGSFDNQIKTYSHGMKQKITIISALVHAPKLWILDEPLTGLDPNSIYQVKMCMKKHAAAGNIVFFSSHLIDVVENLCDRITIIKKGELLCTRSVDEIEAECEGENKLENFYMKTIGDEVASGDTDTSSDTASAKA